MSIHDYARHAIARHAIVDVTAMEPISITRTIQSHSSPQHKKLSPLQELPIYISSFNSVKISQSIMDAVKNAAKAATGQESQFTSGETSVTAHGLAAYIDTHNQAIKSPSRA